ncbi:MAG: nucleotidyltransferase family protein [Kiritimatiellaeota bacterium]|nr:nucleotidyltransferase family protein [Kiritimatiellota bacterium]
MDILNEAIGLAALLGSSDIEWAFVGGVAVGIHGFVRATEDIDIVINRSDLESLDELLRKHGFIINKDSLRFSDGFELYPRIKVIGKDFFKLDVMIPPENFKEILLNRQEGFVSGIRVYVVSKSDLIRMKKGTGRSKDKMDVSALTNVEDEG